MTDEYTCHWQQGSDIYRIVINTFTVSSAAVAQ